MDSPTASAVIDFAVKLEEDSAGYYKRLAEKYDEKSKIFMLFSKENGKNRTAVQRAYYGVISDALEGCFAFNELKLSRYEIDSNIESNESYLESLKRAIDMESRIASFYIDAAKPARSLLADVPRAFERIAKKRKERQLTLLNLLTES
jgi:rubrerythrin